MNTEQIAAAKVRALAVVNGFKTVRDQIARDAVNLARELELREKEVAALKRKVVSLELQIAGGSGKQKRSGFSGVFDDIFDEMKRG